MAFPDPDTYYTIQSVHAAGKVFDVRNESWDPGAPVVLFGPGGAGKHNQQFLLDEGSKPGHVRLVARHSQAALRIDRLSHEDWAPLVQGKPGDTEQEFELRRVGSTDSYQLIAAHSGKALYVKGGAKDNGTPIVQDVRGDVPTQYFRFTNPETRPRKGSLEARFVRATDALGNEIKDDVSIVQVRFLWTLNGEKKESYHQLKRLQSTAFEIPLGSTKIGYEAKWGDAAESRQLGTYRKNLRLEITIRHGGVTNEIFVTEVELPEELPR